MPARLRHLTLRPAPLALVLALVLALGARTAHALPCTRDAQCPADPRTGEAQVCEETHCQVDHARNVPPFSFYVPGEDGYRYLPPLLYFRSSTVQSRVAIQFPFYFRYDVRSDKPPLRSRTDVFPLFLFSRYTSTVEHNWRLWPLLFHDVFTNPGKDVGFSTTVVPFVYYANRQGRHWLILPPLLSGGFHDDKTDTTQLTITLLGYYKRVKDDVWRVFFPLLFDHQTKKERFTLAPFFYHRRTPEFTTTVVFPLVYTTHDQQHTHTSVLPLFDYDATNDGKKAHVLTLLGGWAHDKTTGNADWYVTVPPIFHHQDPKRTVDIAAPIYAHWRALEDHSSGYFVLPFVRQSTPRGSVNTFAGLFWHLTDTASHGSTTFLFPVLGVHQHPGAAGGFLGPIYAWGSHNTGSWGAGIFPLLFLGKTVVAPGPDSAGGTRRHAFLFPLFEHASDDGAGTSTTVVGPTFFHRSKKGWDAGLAPLVYFGRRPGGGYGGVLPLFFHYKAQEPDGVHQTNIIGPVFCSPRPDGYTSGVFPIAFFGKSHRGQGAQASGYQVLFPLFFRFTDGERKDGSAQNERVWSLLFFRQRKGSEATSVLFPLVYAHQTPERTVVATLLGGYARDEAAQTHTLVIGPWISHTDELHEKSTHILFPFAVAYRSRGYGVTTVLPPIFWRVHEGNETDTVVFPFYWRVRKPGYAADFVFPLGGRVRGPQSTTTIVGPFWNRSTADDRHSTGLLPLFVYYRNPLGDNPGSFHFLGTPFGFWMHNDNTQTTRAIFTAAFSFSSPGSSTSGFFPILWHWRRGSASSTLLPFIFHRHDAAQDDSFTVVGPLYFGHHEHDHKAGLVPLFFHHSDDDGSRDVLLPLFYLNRRHDGSTLATWLFGWATHPDDTLFYVGLFSYRHQQNTRAVGLWPLFYFSHDTVTDATTRLVLPLYFHKQFADGRTVSAFTPLLWHYRSVERSTVVGFPLFYDDQVFAESHTTAVVPLFLRSHSEVDGRTNWLFPPLLTWVRTRPADQASDAVMFPLLWHFGGKEKSTTVVLPLYWDFVRGDSRTTVAFPVAYYWRRETAENWLVLNTYYTRGRGTQTGSWHLHFIPLFDVGRPHPHDIDWNVLYGLFGYKRIGRNRTLKLFWLFDAELEPAPRSQTMSWFGGGTGPQTRTSF